MLRKDRFELIIKYFQENNPEAETELHYGNAFELLVAVVLSAQCTDKRVNLITPQLFARFPNPEALAASSPEEIFVYIKSVSYPNNKAKHLFGLGVKLVGTFGSQVPSDVEKLQTLPGVGRKTANVIASVIFEKPTMAVDTHVFRVSKRLGLVDQNSKTPLQVELQLYNHIPSDLVHKAHHWLILHGRYICKARKPNCLECKLSHLCSFFNNEIESEIL